MTRSWQMRMPAGIDRVIIDTPSAATGPELTEYVRLAGTIIIPVLPSPIDIHAVTNFLKEILLLGKMRTIVAANDIKNRSIRIGVVANRVQDNTQVYKPLQKFLTGLNIPFITALQDSHYYSYAFVEGVGVHELRDERMHTIYQQWQPLMSWLDEMPNYPTHPSVTSRQQFEQKYDV
jgi:chromosome partitioning protein